MRNLLRFLSDVPTVSRVILFGTGLTLIVAVSVWIGQNTAFLLPAAASKEAVSVDALFQFMLIVACVIFFSITALIVYASFVFAREPGDTRDGPPIHDNNLLQLVWTTIPVVMVGYLVVYSYDVYRELAAKNPIDIGGHAHLIGLDRAFAAPPPATKTGLPPVVIRVEALQYAWVFHYPGEVAVSELHMPVGRDVFFDLQSNDVIHGFWIPEFRIKQDIIPGRTTRIRLTTREAGKYMLECTMLCGTYHGAMRVAVIVEPQADYDRWLKTQMAQSREITVATRLPKDLTPTRIEQPALRSAATRTLIQNLR